MTPVLYLDIGPLQENNFTGIPGVTAAFARELLGDPSMASRFLYGRYLVPEEAVAALLETRDGRFFRYHMRNCRHRLRLLSPRRIEDDAVVLFPNVKSVLGVFRREAQIVHDLSTLLFPETHHEDTIRHHALTFLRDLKGNEATFCVSEATRTDLLTYFGMDPSRVHAVHLGADVPEEGIADLPGIAEPYVAVLGTIEPRKNLTLVLDGLQRFPELAERYRFVFMGRFGWGKSLDQVLAEYPGVGALHAKGRLIFTGYVDEPTKYTLLRNARFLLFPSLFEGFGLPVLEALKLGTPVVCSYSSSIPEVAGDAGFYFDPFSVEGLKDAVDRFEQVMSEDPGGVARRVQEQGALFNWARFYRGIRDVLFPQIA